MIFLSFDEAFVECVQWHIGLSAFMTKPDMPSWAFHQNNALGKPVQLLTLHPLYLQLGKEDEERQKAYRLLFRGKMSERTLIEIRDASDKAWVLGSDRFRAQIEAQTGRRVIPLARGGDRKSEKYRRHKNQ